MASSRKPSSAELPALVAGQLRVALTPGARVLLALSGGMDSMALLDILSQLAAESQFRLSAVHVNHGISANAAQWAEFCAHECRVRAIPCEVEKVDLSGYRGLGLEGAARQARYDALARHAADVVVLAQHRDDQAETMLLQMLRGSGLRGMAGMAAERSMAGSTARLVRPFIHVPRSSIESYAREHALQWVEDESNGDQRLLRNFLRHRIIADLEARMPDAQAVLARGAEQLAESAALLDQLGHEDLLRLSRGEGLDAAQLIALGDARARNALRRWCEQRGADWPGTARLKELLRQVSAARPAAAITVTTGNWVFRLFRGILYLEPEVSPDVDWSMEWHGEPSVALAMLGGTLRFEHTRGRGLCASRLSGRKLTIRLRRGGEKLRPDCKRPRRDLKYLFIERAIPYWRRDSLPLIFCDGELVAIPGIAEDCHWQAQPGEAGLLISWERGLLPTRSGQP